MSRSRLLLTGCGGAAGITALRLLAGVREQVDVLAADADEYSYACQLADSFSVLPRVDGTGKYRQALIDLVDRWGVEAVIPCHSAELVEMAGAAADLRRRGVRWPAVSSAVARVVADKRALYQLLIRTGLPVPKFGDLLGPLPPPEPGLVRVVKRCIGSGGVGVVTVESGAPLPMMVEQPAIVQVHVAGTEISLDGVVLSDGRILGPVGRIRRSVRHGLAVVSDSLPVSAQLHQLYHATARAAGTTGALNVQLIVDRAGAPWIIDINPRFPAGGLAMSAELGLNLPRTVALDLLYGPDSAAQPTIRYAALRQYRWYTDAIVELEAMASPREGAPDAR
jgi:carbamoyl-phosphate synthase large subunit